MNRNFVFHYRERYSEKKPGESVPTSIAKEREEKTSHRDYGQ